MADSRRCSVGAWDQTVPGIRFSPEGVSNYARIQMHLMKDYPTGEKGKQKFEDTVKTIRREGRNHKYDCLIGVSGGTDSSYLLHIAKKNGLRPLALNLDNGWNSDIAVKNIKKITKALNIDLETYVIDYEEIKDLLRSFIRAGLPWIDAPTDMAIQAILYRIAYREKIKYILIGTDFRSEGKQPIEWTYCDTRMLKFIHNLYGEIKLKTYPVLSLSNLIFYNYFCKIKLLSPFYFLDYDKETARKLLIEEYDWQYYGEHHHENLFTKWAISYWMFEKFKIDKRIITYSAQILNEKIDRKAALNKLSTLPYNVDTIDQETKFVLKKLSITKEEFTTIWNSQGKSFMDYPSFYPIIHKFIMIIEPFVSFLLPVKPKIFYEIKERG